MKVNKRVYHAGDFKDKSENLSVGLHGTSFSSGIFYTTSKEDCENQGAGFNLEHKRPVYSFSLKGLNLFPTTWQDCKTLNLFNKCLYYWPVYQAYGAGSGDIDYMIYYKPIYQALKHCFEDYYADEVPDDERASKFLRELKDSYQIESEDAKESTDEDYSFLDYVASSSSLKELQKCVRRAEPDAHNTFPYLTDLLINGNVNMLKTKVDESLSPEEAYDKWLRGGSDEVNHSEDDMNSMDKVFKPASKDIIAYKGDPYTKEELENFKTKKLFYKKVFASASTNFHAASDYMTRTFDILENEPNSNLVPIMFYITIKKGTPVAFARTDQEVTIGRNTKWTLSNFREEYDSIYEEYYYAFDVVIEKANLKENKLKEDIDNATFDDLKDEIDNFLDNYELAADIDNMLQKVAALVKIDVKELVDIANSISSKYANLYDKASGRFDNWSANKDDDLFATQLLLHLGYQGTYPIDDRCDSTEWGGTIFHKEDLQDIKLEEYS